MWDQAGTGLIVSERLINCPPQLASPLQHALFDEEIPWATEDEPSEELRNSFKFERFLFVSRVYQDNQGPPQPGPGPKKGKRRKVPTFCRMLPLFCLLPLIQLQMGFQLPDHADLCSCASAACDCSDCGGKQAERHAATMVYARPEDEFYHRHSSWSYSFPVTSRPVQKDELQPLRLVMLLSPKQAATAR